MVIPLIVVLGTEKILLEETGEKIKRRSRMPTVKGYTKKVHGKKVHVKGYRRHK